MKHSIFLTALTTIFFASCNDSVTGPEISKGADLLKLPQAKISYQRIDSVLIERTAYIDSNVAIIEGDIAIPIVRDTTKDGGIQIKSWGRVGKLWPDQTMYYAIDSNVPTALVKLIKEAIKEWVDNTKIKIEQWNTPLPAKYALFKITPDGPRSAVGMTGGIQLIELKKDTPKGSIIHEIGHALGVWHEHTRDDRDKFVKIDFSNIRPEAKFNYDKQPGEALSTYDYGSIMHYPKEGGDFAIDPNKPVMTPIPDGSVNIGQRDKLSTKDIEGMKKRYGL